MLLLAQQYQPYGSYGRPVQQLVSLADLYTPLRPAAALHVSKRGRAATSFCAQRGRPSVLVYDYSNELIQYEQARCTRCICGLVASAVITGQAQSFRPNHSIYIAASRAGQVRCEADPGVHQAWKWQKELVSAVLAAAHDASAGPAAAAAAAGSAQQQPPAGALLLLQHAPVYTLGAGSSLAHLGFDAAAPPLPLHRTERGGEVRCSHQEPLAVECSVSAVRPSSVLGSGSSMGHHFMGAVAPRPPLPLCQHQGINADVLLCSILRYIRFLGHLPAAVPSLYARCA